MNRTNIRYLIIGVLVFFLVQNVILMYDNLQNKLPIFGLRLEGKTLTGLSRNKVESFIRGEADKRNRPLVFSQDGKTYQVFPHDLAYKVDPTYLTNQLLQVGRTGNMLQKFIVQEKAIFGMENKMIVGTYSHSLLLLQIKEMQQAFDREPTTETLDFTHNMQAIIPAKDGVKVQVDKLSMTIVKNIANPPQNPLPLPTYVAFATVHDLHELDPIKQQAPLLVKDPISITSNGYTFTLIPDDLRALLVVVERPDPKLPGKTKLVLRLDDKKLNQKLGLFAAPIEAQTHSEFNDEDAKVAILSQFFSGKRRIFDIPTGHNLAQNYVLGAKTSKLALNQSGAETSQQTPKTVFLTFDDGPNAIYHPMILDILKTYGVKATFFLVGQNAQRDSDVAKRTVAEGHLIGDHSLTHSFLPNLSSNRIFNELQATDTILKTLTNNDITFFRPPYGGINSVVITDAHGLGLRIFLWDVDPQDWSEPPVDELVRRVVNFTHDGSNVLLHSNHLVTVRALPRIIESLHSHGYIFKTLDQYPKQEED